MYEAEAVETSMLKRYMYLLHLILYRTYQVWNRIISYHH